MESGAPIVTTDTATAMNYGYNSVRMIRPLLIGERFLGRISVVSVVEKRPRHYLVGYRVVTSCVSVGQGTRDEP